MEQLNLNLSTTTRPAWASFARARLVELVELTEAPAPNLGEFIRRLGSLTWALISNHETPEAS